MAAGGFVIPPMMIYLAANLGIYSTCTSSRMTAVVMTALIFGLVSVLQTGFRQWLLTLTVCLYVALGLIALPMVALSASCMAGTCCL